GRAAGRPGPDRGRGPLDRRRGCRTLPRRGRRHAPGRTAGGLPRGRRGTAHLAACTVRSEPRAVNDGGGRVTVRAYGGTDGGRARVARGRRPARPRGAPPRRARA